MTIAIAELNFHGLKFKVAHDPEKEHTLFTHVDEDVVRKRWWKIQGGDVILDVGAAFGSYSLIALAQGAEFVFCWSPQGEAELLRESLKANGWEDRALIIESGLWSDEGFLQVYDGPPMSTFSANPPASPTGAVIPVKSIDSSSSLWDGKWHVTWMKIDVEGAEENVLKGAENFLRIHRPKILLENHDFKDSELRNRCRLFLASCGYREVETVPHHGVSHSLYEPV